MAAVIATCWDVPRAQPLREGFDDRVTPRRGMRGHGPDHTALRTPAVNMARAGSRAALVLAWGAPHHCRDFTLVQHTELRQRRLHGRRPPRSTPCSGW